MYEGKGEMPKDEQSEIVEKLAEVMEESGLFESVQARPKARVPIVALKDKATGLKCDICMCNRLALINSRLLRAYMQVRHLHPCISPYLPTSPHFSSPPHTATRINP